MSTSNVDVDVKIDVYVKSCWQRDWSSLFGEDSDETENKIGATDNIVAWLNTSGVTFSTSLELPKRMMPIWENVQERW